MFHDIFKTLKKRKIKQKIKPKIIADIHEKDSLILAELAANKDIQLEIKSLKIADYLIGNIAIERKTINDLISSMISKRLMEQLRNLKEYKQNLLIIEGENEFSQDTKLNPNAIRGLILSIILRQNIPIIFTKNYDDTSQYLITLAKQQLKPGIESSLHSRIPKTSNEQKKYVLESFPNIGPITAKKLLKKFNSLINIFNSTEEELEKILKKRAKTFKLLLDKN
jgi:ERCC4-type nuclease